MDLTVQRMAGQVEKTLEGLSAPSQNWVNRSVVSSVIFIVAAEATALLGIAYHTLATSGELLKTTAAFVRLPVGDALSFQKIFTSHISPLSTALVTIFRAPLATLTADKAMALKHIVAAIFPQTEAVASPSMIAKIGGFICNHRYLLLGGTLALAAALGLASQIRTPDPVQNKRVKEQNSSPDKCLFTANTECFFLGGSGSKLDDHTFSCEIDSSEKAIFVPDTEYYNRMHKRLRLACEGTPLFSSVSDWATKLKDSPGTPE